tara:strand:+ start:633 stop:1019 length:387 start_codon:yes stop_codon:yes gene_type:complete
MTEVRRKSYSFRLPFPPSLNRLWRSVPRRGVILSLDGREYRRAVFTALLEQEDSLPPKTLEGRLAVRIEGYAPDNRRRDIDNWVKATLDSIEHTGKVFLDDNQVDRLEVIRREVQPRDGFILVSIYVL